MTGAKEKAMASSENEASCHSTSSASDEPRSLPHPPPPERACMQKFRLYKTLSVCTFVLLLVAAVSTV